MNKTLPSGRELQLLKILWDRGPSTVREAADALAAQGHKLAYTTVLTLLQVMEQKELAGHKSQGKTYAYFARVQRDATYRSLAKGFLDQVFDGALDEYVLHALAAERPSLAELNRLQELINQAKAKKKA